MVACGLNRSGQCDPPCLDEGLAYVQVAAGEKHTVLLRSDGSVVACGLNNYGQCHPPCIHPYVQVAAGRYHTVLLGSDGSAVACGKNDCGQCDLPYLDEDLTYVQVAAGGDPKGENTVLLRSDGLAVACGKNDSTGLRHVLWECSDLFA